MVSSKLDIIIDAKNQSRPAINQVKTDIAGLDGAAGKLSGGLKGLSALGVIAGLGALAAGAASAATELARSAAMADQTKTAFKDLAMQAGASGDAILDALRTASRGSVADADLMLSANRAMLLGVADNVEEFGQLMSIAEARGKAMGLSTTQAFSDIVTGIGRMSPMILDNLGIVIDGEAAYASYAASVGKAASQLSDAEQKQALLNQVVASSRDIVAANNVAGENMVDQFERMDAAIQNAKVALGELFAPAVAQIAQNIADATIAVTDALTSDMKTVDLDKLIERLQRMQAELPPTTERWVQVTQAINALNGDQSAASLRALSQVMQGNYADAGNATDAGLEFAQSLATVGNQAMYSTDQLAQFSAMAVQAQRDAFNADMAMRQRAESGLRGVAVGVVDRVGADETLSWYQRQSVAINEQITAWQKAGYAAEYISDVLMPSYLNGLRESNREVRTMAATVPQISAEFMKLKGIVEGVLSGMLDPGVGVDPEDLLGAMGLREDAINENARRLADIAVNGFADQDWLGKLAEEAPNIWEALRLAADPQAEAAYLLRDFQMGLQPELIDKGRAKELIRKMLLGDQRMADLAQEIAGELAAELGIPLQQAMAAAQGVMGLGDTVSRNLAVGDTLLETGDEAASGFAQGFDLGLSEIGTKTADTLRKKILGEGVANLIRNTGEGAGRVWGDGFLSAVGEKVPQALVDILFLKVMPMVQGGISTEAALTGAQ